MNILKTKLFDDDEQNYSTIIFTPNKFIIQNKSTNVPNAPVKNSKNKQDWFLDDIEDYIYEDADIEDGSNMNNFENVKRRLVF